MHFKANIDNWGSVKLGREICGIAISLNLAVGNHYFPQETAVAQNPRIGLKPHKNRNQRLPKISRPVSLKTAQLGGKTAELATLISWPVGYTASNACSGQRAYWCVTTVYL